MMETETNERRPGRVSAASRCMMIWLVAMAAAAGLAVPAASPAAAQDLAPAGPLADSMDAFLTRAAVFGFAGQVLYAEDGEVLLDAAYGYADHRRAEPFTTETAVGVGSVAKQILAVAMLSLAEDGVLSLQDTVGAWLPDAPDGLAGARLDRLLAHTAGVARGDVVGDFEDIDRAAFRAALLDVGYSADRVGEWQYANMGYALLAFVAEAATGQPLEAVLDARVFEPAGMHRSGMLHALPDEPVAVAYNAWRGQGNPREWRRNWRMFGSGDVVSTAGDLYRLHRAIDTHAVLGEAAAADLFAPHAELREGLQYAYGLFVRTPDDAPRVVEHGGDWIRGYNAAVFRYGDDRGRTLVITSNGRDQHGLSLRQSVQRTLDWMIQGREPPAGPPQASPVPRDRRVELAGTYRADDGSAFHLIHDGALLWIAADGQSAVDVLAGHSPEAAETAHRAAAEFRQLLEMERNGEDGFAWSLGEDGARHLDGYRRDWDALAREVGGVTGYELFGATSRRVTSANARVYGPAGWRGVSFLWRDNDEGGRVGGMLVRDRWYPAAYPAAFPVAVAADGGLVAHDLIHGTTARLSPTDGGGLRVASDVGEVTARR